VITRGIIIPLCSNPFTHMTDHNSVSGCIRNLILTSYQKNWCAPLSLNGTLMGHWNSLATHPDQPITDSSAHHNPHCQPRESESLKYQTRPRPKTMPNWDWVPMSNHRQQKKEVLPRWNQTTYSLPRSVDEGHCLDFVRQVCWNGTTTTRLTRNSPQGTWMS